MTNKSVQTKSNLKWLLCLGALPFIATIIGCGSNSSAHHGEYGSAQCSDSSMSCHKGHHHWSMMKEINFEYNSSKVQPSEMSKITEIARYVEENPKMMVGLDCFMDSHNQNLSKNRALHVHEELVNAGVPSTKITEGKFGAKHLASERSVKVMVCKEMKKD